MKYMILLLLTIPIISASIDYETNLAITCATKFNNANKIQINQYKILYSYAKNKYESIEFTENLIIKNKEMKPIYWLNNIAYEYYLDKNNIINQWGAIEIDDYLVLINCGVNNSGIYITGSFIYQKKINHILHLLT